MLNINKPYLEMSYIRPKLDINHTVIMQCISYWLDPLTLVNLSYWIDLDVCILDRLHEIAIELDLKYMPKNWSEFACIIKNNWMDSHCKVEWVSCNNQVMNINYYTLSRLIALPDYANWHDLFKITEIISCEQIECLQELTKLFKIADGGTIDQFHNALSKSSDIKLLQVAGYMEKNIYDMGMQIDSLDHFEIFTLTYISVSIFCNAIDLVSKIYTEKVNEIRNEISIYFHKINCICNQLTWLSNHMDDISFLKFLSKYDKIYILTFELLLRSNEDKYGHIISNWGSVETQNIRMNIFEEFAKLTRYPTESKRAVYIINEIEKQSIVKWISFIDTYIDKVTEYDYRNLNYPAEILLYRLVIDKPAPYIRINVSDAANAFDILAEIIPNIQKITGLSFKEYYYPKIINLMSVYRDTLLDMNRKFLAFEMNRKFLAGLQCSTCDEWVALFKPEAENSPHENGIAEWEEKYCCTLFINLKNSNITHMDIVINLFQWIFNLDAHKSHLSTIILRLRLVLDHHQPSVDEWERIFDVLGSLIMNKYGPVLHYCGRYVNTFIRNDYHSLVLSYYD